MTRYEKVNMSFTVTPSKRTIIFQKAVAKNQTVSKHLREFLETSLPKLESMKEKDFSIKSQSSHIGEPKINPTSIRCGSVPSKVWNVFDKECDRLGTSKSYLFNYMYFVMK